MLNDDPCPDLEVEEGPESKGVGSWVPEHKHRLLAEYFAGTREAWKKWPNRIFIDPFCGPGRIRVRGEPTTRDGGAVRAWKQSVASGAPFTSMMVGDLSAERTGACAARLTALGAPVRGFPGAAELTVSEMAAEIPSKRALCVAYLDPYNLELLKFPMIETLSRFKVDFAVHFSTMDLQRNVEFEFDPKRARFDETAPGWRDHVNIHGLSKASGAPAFFDYWCAKVRALGFEFSREMPLIPNDRNHPIYRLVFFARHDMATRIWGDVAKGKTQLGFDFGDSR